MWAFKAAATGQADAGHRSSRWRTAMFREYKESASLLLRNGSPPMSRSFFLWANLRASLGAYGRPDHNIYGNLDHSHKWIGRRPKIGPHGNHYLTPLARNDARRRRAPAHEGKSPMRPKVPPHLHVFRQKDKERRT